MPETAARAGRLAEAFRDRGLPVVLVSVVGCAPGRTDNSGTGGGELWDEPSGCRSTRASLLPELLLTLEASADLKHGWRSKRTRRIQEGLCERRMSQELALGARGPRFESGRPDQRVS